MLLLVGLGATVVAATYQNWSGVAAVLAIAAAWELVVLSFMRARWKPVNAAGEPLAPVRSDHRGWMTLLMAFGLLYVKGAYVIWRWRAAWDNEAIPTFGLPRFVINLTIVLAALTVLTIVEAIWHRLFPPPPPPGRDVHVPPLVLEHID